MKTGKNHVIGEMFLLRNSEVENGLKDVNW